MASACCCRTSPTAACCIWPSTCWPCIPSRERSSTSSGPARFLLIYVVAGLGSDLVVFALRKDDPSYRCLGASGSVFGIIVAAIVIDPTTSIVLFLFPVPIPGPVFMIGYAIVAVFLITRPHRGTISHEAHLGGAILGLALAGLLAPRGLEPLLRWFGRWL
jgi:membrane associated rhomboid family serine protease